MGLPVVFLIGLLALFAANEFGDPVSGHAELPLTLAASLLLLLPSALALLARRAVRRRFVLGRLPAVDPELWLRLSMSLSPVTVFIVATEGGFCDLAWQLAGGSNIGGMAAMGLPLVLTEVPRLVLATQATAWLEIEAGALRTASHPTMLPSLREMGAVLRLRLGWIAVVTLPWLILGLSLDLLERWRTGYAFALGTSAGMTIGFLLLLVAVAIVLPLAFRWVFGAHRSFPEPVGAELRRTAAALEFDPKRLYQLPTGMSAVNAMMVGPLPTARCLCITDGLLHVLDADALTGVVAHEVGHARMGHPGLLVMLAVILPLMLLQPLGMLPIDDLAPAWQIAIALPVVLLLWFVVRALAHRFELEADTASVRALGAGPCSRALLAVSHATVAVRRRLLGRLTTLHPDESTRLMTMMRYERDAEFRARFDGTGRRLRLAICGATVLATLAAVGTWSIEWTWERAFWHFHSGDLAAARADRSTIGGDVPARWREVWARFGIELEAASELAPTATDWSTARDAWRGPAGERGIAVLLRDGPAAAKPWFALAADAAERGDADWLLLHQLYDYCRAVEHGDLARSEAVKEVILQRPVPEALAPVFE